MDILWAPWRVEYLRQNAHTCFLCEALGKKDYARSLILEKGSRAFVIMNRFPYNNGHVLIAPLRHVGKVELLNDDEILDINHLLRRIIKAMNQKIKPQGYNVGVNQGTIAGAGLVTHLHYHVVPRWQGDTNCMPVLSDTKVISEALVSTYRAIRDGLAKLDTL